MVGTTPTMGAMIAPAAPARPAPRANVSMNMRGVLMPAAEAIWGFAIVARACRPNAVQRESRQRREGPRREELALGEVDDPHHAEDQGQAEREQDEDRDGVEDLQRDDAERVEAHARGAAVVRMITVSEIDRPGRRRRRPGLGPGPAATSAGTACAGPGS